ncbi:MAG: addiction module protein [Cyclobacteriaceae bacterium]|nr:addiction module protein [Cyclobacteriaceae bacterium]
MIDVNEILNLPAEERQKIADLILESLELEQDDSGITEEQRIELEARLEEYESGRNTKTYSWEEIKMKLHK